MHRLSSYDGAPRSQVRIKGQRPVSLRISLLYASRRAAAHPIDRQRCYDPPYG